MVLHCIVSHNYKNLLVAIQFNNQIEDIDSFISEYWDSLKSKKNTGVSIHGISRDTEIPRTTVKRLTGHLKSKNLVTKNSEGYMIPTSQVNIYNANINSKNKLNYFEFLKLYKSLNSD